MSDEEEKPWDNIPPDMHGDDKPGEEFSWLVDPDEMMS